MLLGFRQYRRLASVCLEVLVEMDEPLETAAVYVARHVNKWPGIGPQEVTGNTIQNWRERERCKPVSVTYRTGLGHAETEIGQWRV